MRTISTDSQKAFWMARFRRLVLTHQPQLRFRLNHSRIDILYAKEPDPAIAAHLYLGNKP